MKFKIIGVVAVLACLSLPSQGVPLFGDIGSALLTGYEEEPSTELKRDKRTMTTICVEIKPSNPYDEPYYMCKGSDSPNYSKGSSNSDSYSPSKQSYNKPSKPQSYPNGEDDSYHSGGVKIKGYSAPSKPDYHPEHSKYDKPAYDLVKEYSSPSKPTFDSHGVHHSESYSHYEVPSKQSSYVPAKPSSSYAEHHDSQDDYSKPHKMIFEKPTAPDYAPKPHAYSHEDHAPAYDHRQPPTEGYPKPSSYESHHIAPTGYSKPSNSYGPSEYSKPDTHDDVHHTYSDDSHSKPSYGGHDGHSYSPKPETKIVYSKPSSHPAKQVSYDHTDHSQYGPSKPGYSEHQQPSSHYSKPTQDYGKPASYTPNDQHASYAPQQANNYRMMPPALMQPAWEQPQSEQLQSDGFGFRSFGAPMEYQQRQENLRAMNQETPHFVGTEGPLRFDLSGADQEAPTLQSAYPQQTYSSPAHPYVPVAPSYVPQYSPVAPSYSAPSYVPAVPSYSPVQSYSPSYAPAAPAPYVPAHVSHGSLAAPPCPQNYLYSYQPVIMSVPCYSLSAPLYGQSLGAPSHVNPLQDQSSPRSEDNSETAHKTLDESQESQENKKKPDSEAEVAPKQSENPKKLSSEIKDEKSEVSQTKDESVGGSVEKPIKETQITPAGSAVVPEKNQAEAPHTQEAYTAMMKMARIAAQLKKSDPSSKESPDGQQATIAAETLPQISRPN